MRLALLIPAAFLLVAPIPRSAYAQPVEFTDGRIAHVAAAVPASLYPDCDRSGALNVADFGCFLTEYAAGGIWPNADGSLAPPCLNVADFGAFLSAYAAGSPGPVRPFVVELGSIKAESPPYTTSDDRGLWTALVIPDAAGRIRIRFLALGVVESCPAPPPLPQQPDPTSPSLVTEWGMP